VTAGVKCVWGRPTVLSSVCQQLIITGLRALGLPWLGGVKPGHAWGVVIMFY